MATTISAALPVPTDPPPANGVLDYLGVDGCVRLPFDLDTARLAAEIAALPADVWEKSSRDPIVQASVESFFAIGYPRGPKPLPPDDRPVMARLPYLRELLRGKVDAQPKRAIVARTVPRGFIPLHTDTPRFFRGTVRLSIQVLSDGVQRLYCDGLWYDMAVGEVWALDNLKRHALHHAGASPRINVLVDYVPTNALVAWLTRGERGLGVADPAATAEMEAMSRERYRRNRWRSVKYELFKLVWRRSA